MTEDAKGEHVKREKRRDVERRPGEGEGDARGTRTEERLHPSGQTDSSGTEKELEEPFTREGGAGG